MGLSYENEVTLVCDNNELSWVEKHFPLNNEDGTRRSHRMRATHYYGDAPVWVSSDFNGTIITMSSGGYGVLDLNSLELPSSLIGFISEVWSCQSQDINYVELVMSDELKPYSDDDEEEDDDYECYWNSSPYEDEKGHLYYDYWTRAKKRGAFYEDTSYYFEDLLDGLKEEDEPYLLPLLTEQRDKFAKLADESCCEAEEEMRQHLRSDKQRYLERLCSLQT